MLGAPGRAHRDPLRDHAGVGAAGGLEVGLQGEERLGVADAGCLFGIFWNCCQVSIGRASLGIFLGILLFNGAGGIGPTLCRESRAAVASAAASAPLGRSAPAASATLV
jgi:hypothetical protein